MPRASVTRPSRRVADPLLPPEGFSYHGDFLSAAEEAEILHFVATVPFVEVRFHGYPAKRRVAHFGYGYDLDRRAATPTTPLPELLRPYVARAARIADVSPAAFAEFLLTHYPAGAGIGWHRDAPAFGAPVVGISLAGEAVMRLRPFGETRRSLAVRLAPRSLYILDGAARFRWQHHIPPGGDERYSLTLRTIKRATAKS